MSGFIEIPNIPTNTNTNEPIIAMAIIEMHDAPNPMLLYKKEEEASVPTTPTTPSTTPPTATTMPIKLSLLVPSELPSDKPSDKPSEINNILLNPRLEQKEQKEQKEPYDFKLFDDSDMHFGIISIEIAQTQIVATHQDVLFSDDISGSMEDLCADGRSKMHHVVHTTKNMITYLGANPSADVSVEVYGFDDTLEEIIPLVKVTEDNTNNLHNTIEKKLRPRNSTNIEIALQNVQSNTNKRIHKNPEHIQTSVFMTDGNITKGQDNVNKLIHLIPTNTNSNNVFIGFGTDHDAKLLQTLASANKNGSYYFVDKVENAGLVFGEILHGILYTALRSVVIEVQNGEIYNYETNEWSNTLEISFIVSEAKKQYHVRSTTPALISATIEAINVSNININNPNNKIKEEVDRLPKLVDVDDKSIQEVTDLSKYMFRQRTQELLFKARKISMTPTHLVSLNQTISDEQSITTEMKKFLHFMKAYMQENNLTTDEFYNTMCDDIIITLKTFRSKKAYMYSAARQNSQGKQLSYNINHIDDADLDNRRNIGGRLNVPKLHRQNAFCVNQEQQQQQQQHQSLNFHLDLDVDVDDYDYNNYTEDPAIEQRPVLSRANTTPMQIKVMRSLSQGTPLSSSIRSPKSRSNYGQFDDDDEDDDACLDNNGLDEELDMDEVYRGIIGVESGLEELLHQYSNNNNNTTTTTTTQSYSSAKDTDKQTFTETNVND